MSGHNDSTKVPAPPWLTSHNKFTMKETTPENDIDEVEEESDDHQHMKIGHIESRNVKTLLSGNSKLIILMGSLLGFPCRFLIDSGATGEFVGSSYVENNQLRQ